MATATHLSESASPIDTLIRPAISKLVSESEGAYRCERDLHHHFTVCLNSLKSLELGTYRRRVFMERPALACYGKGARRGNLDYFFPSENSGPYRDRVFQEGVAVELNYDYRDGYLKIKRDIQKLIDPDSAFTQSVYFVYCKKRDFFEAVKQGIERACNDFEESRPAFRLPLGFHVILVEHVRRGGHIAREASIDVPCVSCDLQWKESFFPAASTARVEKPYSGPADSGESEGPYVLNANFDREELRNDVDAFESSVKRQRDLSLARRLRLELLERETPNASPALIKQLSKWCKTDGIYSDRMDVGRRISYLLFGTVLDRSQLGV